MQPVANLNPSTPAPAEEAITLHQANSIKIPDSFDKGIAASGLCALLSEVAVAVANNLNVSM